MGLEDPSAPPGLEARPSVWVGLTFAPELLCLNSECGPSWPLEAGIQAAATREGKGGAVGLGPSVTLPSTQPLQGDLF